MRPIVAYGTEIWTNNKINESKLLVFERENRRKILIYNIYNWRIEKTKDFTHSKTEHRRNNEK